LTPARPPPRPEAYCSWHEVVRAMRHAAGVVEQLAEGSPRVRHRAASGQPALQGIRQRQPTLRGQPQGRRRRTSDLVLLPARKAQHPGRIGLAGPTLARPLAAPQAATLVPDPAGRRRAPRRPPAGPAAAAASAHAPPRGAVLREQVPYCIWRTCHNETGVPARSSAADGRLKLIGLDASSVSRQEITEFASTSRRCVARPCPTRVSGSRAPDRECAARKRRPSPPEPDPTPPGTDRGWSLPASDGSRIGNAGIGRASSSRPAPQPRPPRSSPRRLRIAVHSMTNRSREPDLERGVVEIQSRACSQAPSVPHRASREADDVPTCAQRDPVEVDSRCEAPFSFIHAGRPPSRLLGWSASPLRSLRLSK
jgi:hypothetical protein